MDMRNNETARTTYSSEHRRSKTTNQITNLSLSLQERQLQLLKNRLLPLTKHPIYGPKVDLSDTNLLKWLHYCDMSALYADAKMRKSLEYRRKYHIDSLLTTYTLPDFAKYYPGGVCGTDKEGSPVYYELFGILNLKEIMESSTREQLIKFKIYQHEAIIKHLQRLSRASGKKIANILVIVDMQMCSRDTLWNPALRAWAEIIEILQALYPRLVKEVLIINVHWIYPEVYISLRPYLSRSTLSLIRVLGEDYLKHLLKRVEKHEIPAFLGGYMCDYNNNPYCRAHLNWNGQVPQYLQFTNKRMVAHVTEEKIPGGGKHVEEYHVPTANSLLVWQFCEVSHPIIFSVFLNTIDDQAAILSRTLVSANLHQHGSLICPKPGRYYISFDNCKDYAKPAKIVVVIEVKLPQDLMARMAPKIPIGDTINFRHPIGDKEREFRRKLFSDYPHLRTQQPFGDKIQK